MSEPSSPEEAAEELVELLMLELDAEDRIAAFIRERDRAMEQRFIECDSKILREALSETPETIEAMVAALRHRMGYPGASDYEIAAIMLAALRNEVLAP